MNQYEDQPTLMGQDEIPPKKIVSRAGFALFIMSVVILLSQGIIDYVVTTYQPSILDTDWYIWAVTAATIVVLGFPVYYLMMKRIPNSVRGEVVKLKPVQFFVIFFICAAAMYITNFFSVALTFVIALLKGEELINPAASAILDGNFVITLIYAVFVAPTVEELIFRKLLLDKLRRFGDLPAILMTGIAFGLFHMNLSQMFYAAVIGFVLAYVAIKTNTVKYSIILHMMINFIATIIAPFATGGSLIAGLLICLWVFTALAIGIVFFVLNLKKIKFEKSVPLMKTSSYFLNMGTILYTLICIVMIVIITIS